MRFRFLFIVLFFTTVLHAQEEKSDFETFRKDVLTNYNEFQKSILDDYATFLDGVWKNYQIFKGIVRDAEPKPQISPKVPADVDKSDPVIQVPKNRPEEPISHPEIPQKTNKLPQLTIGQDVLETDFFGLQVSLPKLQVNLSSVSDNQNGEAWRALSKDSKCPYLISMIMQTKEIYGLNDWLTFQLVGSYSKQLGDSKDINQVALLSHYLLCNLGFDVRLAKSKNKLFLLIPCKHKIYACTYITIGTEKYYIYNGDLSSIRTSDLGNIYTCELPSDYNLGRTIDLQFHTPLTLPANNTFFSVSHNGVTLEGEINHTIIDMVKYYPQMPISHYAKSCIDQTLQKTLVKQIQRQIDTSSNLLATNKLLSFIQYAFEYETDTKQHGYEKPYFLEEMFYYPQSDCEDRAVLFAVLLRKALDINSVFAHYPGHVCVAVLLEEPINGDGFKFKEKNYYISDPTYIGAATGQCMPNYRHEQPELILW